VRQCARWQGHTAILVAFAGVDMQDHAGTVTMGDLERDAFLNAQAAGIDDGQTDMVVGDTNAGEDLADLIQAEDDGEDALLWCPHEVEKRPRSLERVFIQKRDGTQDHRAGTAGKVFLIAEGEEILAELFRGELIRRQVEVPSEAVDGAEIGLLRSWGQATELHGLDHPLA